MLAGIFARPNTSSKQNEAEQRVSDIRVPQEPKKQSLNVEKSSKFTRTVQPEQGAVLPLTDAKGRCQVCSNHCRPVKQNCKKRQRALAKRGY